MLEAKLFLGAFSSYDRHRDMQMDIDNMSYEAQNICNLVFDKSSKICLGGKLQQICAMFYSDFGVFCLTEAKRNHQVQGKYDSIIVEVKSYYMSMSRYRDDKKRKGEIMKVYANDQIKTCVEFPECFV
ncbi:hypothetical protein ZEAMMB73_Zm00001d002239 [Zea mays]|nr:hypothetical protein ZEAMMB73_Zm00001d002239 [Zea mays]ONM13509.1 hypothetical protein ZEAMMB73_Zm00001d002239 [Zea mays]ONM13638.1 hypothetical protein ZEAMMB73_Zm00001d002239 [Zea mays]